MASIYKITILFCSLFPAGGECNKAITNAAGAVIENEYKQNNTGGKKLFLYYIFNI